MFKHYFERIHGVDIWPIISLSIFFLFFILLIIWVVTARKSDMTFMSKMPLEDSSSNSSSEKRK